jgi:hypothetical protein
MIWSRAAKKRGIPRDEWVGSSPAGDLPLPEGHFNLFEMVSAIPTVTRRWSTQQRSVFVNKNPEITNSAPQVVDWICGCSCKISQKELKHEYEKNHKALLEYIQCIKLCTVCKNNDIKLFIFWQIYPLINIHDEEFSFNQQDTALQ